MSLVLLDTDYRIKSFIAQNNFRIMKAIAVDYDDTKYLKLLIRFFSLF